MSMLHPIRVGDYSVERDVDPLDAKAPPIVRLVFDRCELSGWPPAFTLRGDEREITVRQLRVLAELAPGDVQLDGVGSFVAVARRTSGSDGHVALERCDESFLFERLTIPLADAERIAAAIEACRSSA